MQPRSSSQRCVSNRPYVTRRGADRNIRPHSYSRPQRRPAAENNVVLLKPPTVREIISQMHSRVSKNLAEYDFFYMVEAEVYTSRAFKIREFVIEIHRGENLPIFGRFITFSPNGNAKEQDFDADA